MYHVSMHHVSMPGAAPEHIPDRRFPRNLDSEIPGLRLPSSRIGHTPSWDHKVPLITGHCPELVRDLWTSPLAYTDSASGQRPKP